MVAAILLCGGQSRRMGQDKAELPFGESSLLAYQAQKLHDCGLFAQIFVSTKEPRAPLCGTEQILDDTALSSPLVGLHSALSRSPSVLNFVLAVDCPFVQISTIETLLDIATNTQTDAVFCADSAHLHPLIGIYRKSALTGIQTMLARHILRLQAITQFCTFQILHCSPNQTTNCNTPQDYQKAQKLLGEIYGR